MICQIRDSVFDYRQYDQDRKNIPAGSCDILQYSCVAWLVKSNTKFVFVILQSYNIFLKEPFFVFQGWICSSGVHWGQGSHHQNIPEELLMWFLPGLTLACHNLASGLTHTHVWHSDVLKGSLYEHLSLAFLLRYFCFYKTLLMSCYLDTAM